MTHARRILLPATLLGTCLGGLLVAAALPAQQATAPKAPRMKVRRDRCFLVMIMSTPLQLLCCWAELNLSAFAFGTAHFQ